MIGSCFISNRLLQYKMFMFYIFQRRMAPPTLLRVKRRKDKDPLDVLVLSAKKRKTCDPETDAGDFKILKLATTIEAADDSKTNVKIAETVNKLLSNKKSYPNFEELKQQYKKHSSQHKDSPSKEVAKEKISESRQDNRSVSYTHLTLPTILLV